MPYCATRCGYCDFNTYTATELRGSGGVLASRDNYADDARSTRSAWPARCSATTRGRSGRCSSAAVRRRCSPPPTSYGCWRRSGTSSGSRTDAEITTEANPESVDPAYLAELREGGFNRISFGMQSARQHVLKVLDRTHTPGRPEACVAEARAAGFDHVNLDLIYGTPGESDDDWRASLDAAIGAGPDHVSAYALIVEEGTQLARRIRRGEVPMTDDDVARRPLPDRRRGAGARRASPGTRSPTGPTPEAGRCLHNELYWRGADWWGAGPGAHSHVGGVRWWNVKHPGAYAAALAEGRSPGAGRELLVGGGPPGRADPAGAAAARRRARCRCCAPAGLAASGRARWRTACWRRGRTRRGGPC